MLAAAAIAVKRDGEQEPLATIAREAGVGVGTLYRNYPGREALLAALAVRSYELILDMARQAASSGETGIRSIQMLLDQMIQHHAELVLPLHGGPLILDDRNLALGTEIGVTIDRMLQRGRRDGTVRRGVSSMEIVFIAVSLSSPLPHVPDWMETARRQLAIYLDGLSLNTGRRLPGRAITRTAFKRNLAREAQKQRRPAR